MGERIYVTDRVVLAAGAARAFVEAYLAEYVPGAIDRGFTLERVLVSPPVWLADEEHVMTATWTVDGPPAWWQAAVAGRHDRGPAQFWESREADIIERTRSMSVEVADMEGLCDV